jgi:exocyst complex component 3
MNDAEAINVKLAELLRHPDDLDKIPALKSEFIRKKAAIDAQLKQGLKEQLEVTQTGMNSIGEGQRTVNLIKEEMQRIDKLCIEAQNLIKDFPHINLVAQTHRNFEQVEKMKKDIDTFDQRLAELEQLLQEDEQALDVQPNVLRIHYGLSQLREIKDAALDQAKGSDDSALELIQNLQLYTGYTLQDYFNKLDELVETFDDHIGSACLNLIDLLNNGCEGLIVRIALIIEEEEKNDQKVKALQDAQKEYKELASKFKSITSGPKELRGYKEKFLKAIEFTAQALIDDANERFLEDPEKLEKSVRWFFNNLYAVREGMVLLMPKKWKIFKTYTDIYHKLMHDWLVSRIEDKSLTSLQMLAIVQWVEKYYAKMAKLGIPEDRLSPHVIDNRGAELVREYRQLIVKSIEEWMDRMAVNDRSSFIAKSEDALDRDANGCYRTKTLGDMWRMLRENLLVAGGSDRADVVEGVVDSMFRALTTRQRMWQDLLDSESAKYSSGSQEDSLQAFQDWIIALANDQIACIDDGDDSESSRSYLTRFEEEFTPLVSPQYAANAAQAVNALRDGYVDLGTHCISVFVNLIFTVDFKTVLPEFFTPAWYSNKRVSQITSTFQDYIQDYQEVLHPSLADILIEELSDALLIKYLSSVRNRGAKFKRADPYVDKIKDDVLTAFNFFQNFSNFQDIKAKWRVVDSFVQLLEADKASVPVVFEDFKVNYWDAQIGWIEAVLRARDDFERSMINAVKAKTAEMYVERGAETIMSKVK